MLLISLFCIISLTLKIEGYQGDKGDNTHDAFTKNGIVSDIIDVAPTKTIQIKYSQHKHVNRGNELAPKDVGKPPQVSYISDSNHKYTLLMVDPDVPSRQDPNLRSVQHWLVVNIPGKEVNQGETLTEYFGSAPKENTGLHRYVFLVYKQPQGVKFDEPYRNNTHGSTRPGFSVRNFAAKYKLGNPIAGNFYKAQYDETVPARHEQLTS